MRGQKYSPKTGGFQPKWDCWYLLGISWQEFFSQSTVRLVRVLQLMFCFYYYSFLSKGGIKSLKDEDKLECFDVKDGRRLYLNDLGRILHCYRTIIPVHVLQNCNA